MPRHGNVKARAALELASSPNRLLSTVQIGITLIGILAGVFGGASIAEKLTVRLDSIPILAPYSNAVALCVVVQQFPFYHTLIFFGCAYRDFTLHKAYSIQNIRITQISNLIF